MWVRVYCWKGCPRRSGCLFHARVHACLQMFTAAVFTEAQCAQLLSAHMRPDDSMDWVGAARAGALLITVAGLAYVVLVLRTRTLTFSLLYSTPT